MVNETWFQVNMSHDFASPLSGCAGEQVDQEDGGAQHLSREEVHGQRLHPALGGGTWKDLDIGDGSWLYLVYIYIYVYIRFMVLDLP